MMMSWNRLPQEGVKRSMMDLVAVTRELEGALGRQLRAAALLETSYSASDIIAQIRLTLSLNGTALERRIRQLEGDVVPEGNALELIDYVCNLYDKMHAHGAARMLRDDYAALAFLFACYSIAITTAEGCRDAESAILLRKHQEQIPRLMIQLGDVIPRAVAQDLAANGADVAARAYEEAVTTQRDAWRTAVIGDPRQIVGK